MDGRIGHSAASIRIAPDYLLLLFILFLLAGSVQAASRTFWPALSPVFTFRCLPASRSSTGLLFELDVMAVVMFCLIMWLTSAFSQKRMGVALAAVGVSHLILPPFRPVFTFSTLPVSRSRTWALFVGVVIVVTFAFFMLILLVRHLSAPLLISRTAITPFKHCCSKTLKCHLIISRNSSGDVLLVSATTG